MTSVEQIPDIVEHVRTGFDAGVLRTIASRRAQLKQLRRMLVEQEDRLVDALAIDVGKPRIEAYTTEIAFTINEIDHTLKHLEAWTKPHKVKVPLTFKPGSGRLHPQPLGTVLHHRPVELPGAAAARSARAGARRRQHRRAQAVGGHPDRRRRDRRPDPPLPRRARRRRS